MLVSLSIRDFVLIDRLDIEFASGFTALTGETGAGKSIVLDALGLACGAKADASLVKRGAMRAEITAAFSVNAKSAVAALLKETANDDESGEVLLRRVVEAEGRSRAFINGRPAAISELKLLGEKLLDVHAQHEHQSLTKPATQRDWLDAYGGALPERARVALAWNAWQTAQRTLERARTDAIGLARERDALTEQAEFLQQLAPTSAEWTTLSDEQSRIANAQTLIDAASGAVNSLTDQDDSLTQALDALISKLNAAGKFDSTIAAIAQGLETASIHMHDAAQSLRSYVDKFDIDPTRASEVENRMSALHQAARRFRIPVEQLEGLCSQTQTRLNELAQSTDIAALEAEMEKSRAMLNAACDALTQKRTVSSKKLERAIMAVFKDLVLTNARFDVQCAPLQEPASTGAEEIIFRFSSHPTLPLAPIQKTASGGELARVALAIMVSLAQVDGVPTLVFDEVDVGIGGSVAATVGAHLRALAKNRQVFAVTHQAQVAACAHQHFAVRKQETKSARGVTLDALAQDARVSELARMMAGQETTKATLALASEMLGAGQKTS